MNLVVGATGWLGGEVCKRLIARGEKVRALVRKTSDREKIERLRKLGAEIATGDLQDRASLDRALRGVKGVISTASTTFSRQPHDSLGKTDLEGHVNLIAAAKNAGVKQFVFVSFSGNLEGDSPLHVAKRTVEKRLRESGLTYTILRPSCFMEIWLSPALGLDFQNRKAQVFGSGDQLVSFISLHDVAEFAVGALLNPKAANKTIELGGPEAVSPNQAVRMFEGAVGGAFEVTHVPQSALQQQFDGATDEYQKTFAALGLGVCGGDPIDMKETTRTYAVKLTSVRDYVKQTTAR